MNLFIPPGKLFAVDTECTGLDVWHGDRPFAISIFNEQGEYSYAEWEVDPFTREVYPPRADINLLRKFLCNPQITKVFHNAKFDIRMLHKLTGVACVNMHDTYYMLHGYHTEEVRALKPLCQKLLDIPADDQKDLRDEVARCRTLARKKNYNIGVSIENDYWLPRHLNPKNRLCQRYCIQDTERTMLLFKFLEPVLIQNDTEQWYEFQRRLFPAVYEMETRGVRVLIPKIHEEIAKYRNEKETSLKTLRTDYNWPDFNPNSPKQVATLLFNKCGLSPTIYTASGQPSTGIQAIEGMADNPVVILLRRYKTAEKATGTFLEKYMRVSVKELGEDIIHAEFNPVQPRTDRFSCKNPNLQQIPSKQSSRSIVPLDGRMFFGPRKGYLWASYDYHQVEGRIFADVAQEPSMLKALEEGRDMHTECTLRIWSGIGNPKTVRRAMQALEISAVHTGAHRPPLVLQTLKRLCERYHLDYELQPAKIATRWLDEFEWNIVAAEKSLDKKNTRNHAKDFLFARIFGGGLGAIQRALRCSVREAEELLTDYNHHYPLVDQRIKEAAREARRNGFIFTRFGKRVNIPDEKYYRAMNYMVQGSAAGLMKLALVRCYDFLKKNRLDAYLVLTIHDELVFEIRCIEEKELREILWTLGQIMEDSQGRLTVPTPVELSVATENWMKKDDVKWYTQRNLQSMKMNSSVPIKRIKL